MRSVDDSGNLLFRHTSREEADLQGKTRPLVHQLRIGWQRQHGRQAGFDVGEASPLELLGLEEMRLAKDAADL